MKHYINRHKALVFTIIMLINPLFYSIGQTWELKWSDEFDYTGLPDQTKWGYDVGGGGWGNNELEYYTDKRSENARVENGTLIIEAIKEVYGGKNYTSARLVTKSKGDWKYGKIEIRAKIPGGRGAWPAIWMLPTDWVYGNWPKSGEIDIMEYVGYDPKIIHGTVHTDAYNHTLGTQKGDTAVYADAETAFPTYSIQWTNNKIMFFVDDWKYFTFFSNATWQTWPFDQKFHLLLNIAVGGSWGGVQGVDDNIFPIKMVVDYVRVYQDITLSINRLDESEVFDIYPNPASNRVIISSLTSFSKIEVYSFTGTQIAKYNFDKTKNKELNISNLNKGNYVFVIKNNEQKVIGKQTVIKL